MKPIIVVDIGGTNIKAGLVDSLESTRSEMSMPTFYQLLPNRSLTNSEKLDCAKEITHHVGEVILDLIEKSRETKEFSEKFYDVGISVPGIISQDGEILTGVVFGNFFLRKAIEDYIHTECWKNLEVKIHIENDANCGAYAHGEGQTLMIGTNLGSALNIDGELIGRNTQIQQKWSDYCIFDEVGYAVRLNKKEAWNFFREYSSWEKFDNYFKVLSKENEDSPGLVRLEQLLGGNAISRMFNFLYTTDAKKLHEIVDGTCLCDPGIKSAAENIWKIEGTLRGYTIATLQKEMKTKGYSAIKFYIGGKVANALDHMLPFAEKSAKDYGSKNFEIKLSSYENPNLIGVAIAYQKAFQKNES